MFKGKRFTPAMIVAMIALAVALSGTAVAGTAKLITGSQIANGTIKLTHLNKSAKSALKGERGATGVQGPVGAQGAQGPSGRATGAKGDAGLKGEVRALGPQGRQGCQRGNGADGRTASTLSAGACHRERGGDLPVRSLAGRRHRRRHLPLSHRGAGPCKMSWSRNARGTSVAPARSTRGSMIFRGGELEERQVRVHGGYARAETDDRRSGARYDNDGRPRAVTHRQPADCNAPRDRRPAVNEITVPKDYGVFTTLRQHTGSRPVTAS